MTEEKVGSTFAFTFTQVPSVSVTAHEINLIKLHHHLTFLIFPGVGVPAIRLLDGVLIAVPYNMSSCVCLVFFSCYFKPKINNVVILTTLL